MATKKTPKAPKPAKLKAPKTTTPKLKPNPRPFKEVTYASPQNPFAKKR